MHAPPPLSPPPSAHTNQTPAGQSVHQQFLSAVHKALYHCPFSRRGISSVVRACSQPMLQVYRAALFLLDLRSLDIDWTFSVLHI